MRSFWLCAGANGKKDSLDWLRQAVQARQPDGVLFAGGIANPCGRPGYRESMWSLAREDVLFVEEFFESLGRLGVFSALIHSSAGGPLGEFLQLAMHAELEFPNVHVVHVTPVEAGDLMVIGIGGALADHHLLGGDSYSRPEAEYFLRPLWSSDKPRKVLLLPEPPPGPLSKKEANPLVADLIDSLHPNLCLVNGSSERRGTQQIGNTLVVNPGRLADGFAAWLNWTHAPQVEMVNLRQLSGHQLAEGLGSQATT
jgi:hypothetical protein